MKEITCRDHGIHTVKVVSNYHIHKKIFWTHTAKKMGKIKRSCSKKTKRTFKFAKLIKNKNLTKKIGWAYSNAPFVMCRPIVSNIGQYHRNTATLKKFPKLFNAQFWCVNSCYIVFWTARNWIKAVRKAKINPVIRL